MPHPALTKTVVSLKISQVIYFIAGAIVFLPLLSQATPYAFYPYIIALVVFALGIGIFIGYIIRDLDRGRHWAWIAAVITCCIYLPSIFLPLGIIGLIGLFNDEVKKDFLTKKKK